jgi:hypothetical protein
VKSKVHQAPRLKKLVVLLPLKRLSSWRGIWAQGGSYLSSTYLGHAMTERVVVVLVVGPISTAAIRAYCTLTPQWNSVIHLQRRRTPNGVRDLC